MRIGYYFVIALAMTCQAHALETAAGADTVNSSQVGINAKIDAGNAIITGSMNQILQCNMQGKLFSSTTNVCVDPTEPLAKKIAACTTAKQFYNQTTGQCQASAPDLTTQLNTTNTLLNKMIACNNAKQFYSSTTGACSGSATGTPVVNTSRCSVIGVNDPQQEKKCPTGMVMMSAESYGISTGSKEWFGNFRCCALKMQ